MTMDANDQFLEFGARIGERIGSLCSCTGGLASDYRLECLKLAFKHHQSAGAPDGDVVEVADELFKFVTNGLPPEPAQLYVIENREEPHDSDSAEARFLSITGSWIHYAAERYAYRFRSFDEAAEAMVKFHGELGGDMTIVPLPLGAELF